MSFLKSWSLANNAKAVQIIIIIIIKNIYIIVILLLIYNIIIILLYIIIITNIVLCFARNKCWCNYILKYNKILNNWLTFEKCKCLAVVLDSYFSSDDKFTNSWKGINQ